MNWKNLLTSRGIQAVAALVAIVISSVLSFRAGKGVDTGSVIESGQEVYDVLREDPVASPVDAPEAPVGSEGAAPDADATAAPPTDIGAYFLKKKDPYSVYSAMLPPVQKFLAVCNMVSVYVSPEHEKVIFDRKHSVFC